VRILYFAYVTLGHSQRVNHAWHVSDPHSNSVRMHILPICMQFFLEKSMSILYFAYYVTFVMLIVMEV